MVKIESIRSQSGSAMTLLVVFAAFALVVLLVIIWKLMSVQVQSNQSFNAAQSSALAAARELSRIVVKDENFGYIGLFDSPPVGKATLAADGEPTPVTGINSLWAQIRLEMLLADRLDNGPMREFAEVDYQKATAASTKLAKALSAAIQPQPSPSLDLNGVAVDVYGAAKESYLANSHGLINPSAVKKFSLSLGWLDTDTVSGAPSPLPAKSSPTAAALSVGEFYKAFTDLAVGKHSFYLAGLGKQPTLVDGKFFRPPDGKRLCSAVRVDTVVETDQSVAGKANAQIKASATAIPGAATTRGPAGVFLVTVNPAATPTASNLHNLLNLSSITMKVFSAQGGDYPRDKGAQLVETGRENAGRACSRCLYDWLKTSSGKVDFESLQQAIERPFNASFFGAAPSNANVFYEMDKDGIVHVTARKRNPFIDTSASENQYYALMETANTIGGAPITVTCRDQVFRTGESGGKHWGQPQPANPINWCDLPYFDNNPEQATAMGRGAQYLGVVPRGNRQGCAGGKKAISIESVVFENASGHVLSPQPRKSYYGAGLAASIDLSSR
jgi:hypothetical protein